MGGRCRLHGKYRNRKRRSHIPHSWDQSVHTRLARPTYNQFKSEAFFLEVPARPAAPVFTIDFFNSQTTEDIPASVLHDGVPGGNKPLLLNPGHDVNFQVAAAEPNQGNPGNFAGEVFTLVVPDRPATPAFEIDYIKEQTTEIVPDTVEYRINYSPTIQQGEGTPVSLQPGTTVSLGYVATVTHFRSLEQNLMVPGRPQAPSFSINYILEETNESLPSTVEYSNDQGTTFTQANGNPVALTLGSNYLFRYKATITQFHSMEQNLDIPARLSAPANPVVNDVDNTFDWTFVTSYENINYYEYSTNSGISWEACMEKPIDIGNVNLSAGEVMVRIAASNVSGMERFSGNALASDADFTISTGISTPETGDILLYPNPVTEYLKFQTQEDCQLKSVRIMSSTGKVLLYVTDINSSESLNISNFSPGIYIVEIQTKGKVIRKNILKN